MPGEPDASIGAEITQRKNPPPDHDTSSIGSQSTHGGVADRGFTGDLPDIEVTDLSKRYRIVRELGRGGMGEVLLAVDLRLGREVAIKRILDVDRAGRGAHSRFLSEATAIAALNHPNIVMVHDYGHDARGPFFVMEYVAGGTVADRSREAMDPDEAVRIACQVCAGLARAHDVGIVHRDIKPSNILLTTDGVVKISDFGLAKAAMKERQVTSTGAVMGTPDFMPPEQRQDAALVDQRSDQWSLAATLYQMVTGRSPRVIRLDEVLPGIREILARALEDDKERRWPSVREFGDALERCREVPATASVDALAKGQCPACRTPNDVTRRFCRACGGSLESPCLGCHAPMPGWEEICGACGARQTPLLEQRRSELAASRERAEKLLENDDFTAAAAVARDVAADAPAALGEFHEWADQFAAEVAVAHDRQRERAAALLHDALAHEQAHDFRAALAALQSVPPSLRGARLPDCSETVAEAHKRVARCYTEVRRLADRIKARLADGNREGLLDDVDRLAALQPGHEAAAKLRQQLVEREARLEKDRDAAVREAEALLDKNRHAAARHALATIPQRLWNDHAHRVDERAASLALKLGLLQGHIESRLLDGDYDRHLLDLIDQYLVQIPDDVRMQAKRCSVIQVLDAVERAGELRGRLQFAEAIEFLDGLPQPVASCPVVRDLRNSLLQLKRARNAASRAIQDAQRTGHLTKVASRAKACCDAYASLLVNTRLTDPEFAVDAEWLTGEARRLDGRRRVRSAVAAAAVAIGLVVLAGTLVGTLVARRHRAGSLQAARTAGRWDKVVALDPGDGHAWVERSRQRLAQSPPDIDGAFEDLKRARQARALVVELDAAYAAAAAAFAAARVEDAAGERIEQAEEAIGEARKRGLAPARVEAAMTAIGDAYARRAQRRAAAGDTAAAAGDLSKARSLKAPPAAITAASQAVAVAHASRAMQHVDAGEVMEAGRELAVAEKYATEPSDEAIVHGWRLLAAAHAWRARERAEAGDIAAATDEAERCTGTLDRLSAENKAWVSQRLTPPRADEAPPLPADLRTIRNSLGMSLAPIPEGRFRPFREGGDVDIAAFSMGTCEVTQQQWRSVMKTEPWKEGGPFGST